MPKIFISPSNQNDNMYFDKKTNECENCEKIAVFLEKALTRCGFETKVAERKDNAATRCKKSVKWKADLHLPIHTNAFNTTVQGVEVYTLNGLTGTTKDKANTLASALCKAIAGISPSGNNRGVKTANFQELRDSAFSVYPEIDFHDNKTAGNWLITEQEKIAETICKVLCEHYNVAYTTDEPFKKGDFVMFCGDKHHSSATSSKGYSATPGKAEVTAIKLGASHPYHLVRVKGGTSSVYGWVDANTVKRITYLYNVGDTVNITADGTTRAGIVESVSDTHIVVSAQTIKQ